MVSVFLTSPGRCGSHWLGWMLRDALGLEKVTLVPQGTKDRWQRLVSEVGDRDGCFYIQHPPLGYLEGITPRIIALVRDPRDIAISMAYYALREETDLRQLEIAWHLKDIPRGASEAEMLAYFKQRGFNYPWWGSYRGNECQIPHLIVWYEDFVRDTYTQLRRVLNFLGHSLSAKKVRGVIQGRSFESFSGGRERGVEDKSHHYRKGVVGDWANYFSPTEDARFCDRHSRYMRYLGYGDSIRHL